MIENEENKKRLIKIGLYLSIFLLAIIFTRLTGDEEQHTSNDNKNNEEHNAINNNIIDEINNINDKYYSSKVKFILDDDAITLEYEKLDILEMGIKKYHNVKTEYIKKADKDYYKFENGNFIKLNDFVEFDYDRTFLELSNIKKLLTYNSEDSEYISNDNTVIKKSYGLKDAYKIYNEYNNTNYISLDEGKIFLLIEHNNDKIKLITLNITDFYNSINKQEKEEVKYEITFESGDEEDIKWIVDKLN